MRILALRQLVSCSVMAKLEPEHRAPECHYRAITIPATYIASPLTRFKMYKKYSTQWRSAWNCLLAVLVFSSLSILSPPCFFFLIRYNAIITGWSSKWESLKLGRAGLVSWVCNLCGLTGAHVQKAPVLGLMLCCSFLEILHNLSLNLCVVNEAPWDKEAWLWAKEISAMCRYACLLCSFTSCLHRTLEMPREHRIPVNSGFTGVQPDSKQVQDKHVLSTTK